MLLLVCTQGVIVVLRAAWLRNETLARERGLARGEAAHALVKIAYVVLVHYLERLLVLHLGEGLHLDALGPEVICGCRIHLDRRKLIF